MDTQHVAKHRPRITPQHERGPGFIDEVHGEADMIEPQVSGEPDDLGVKSEPVNGRAGEHLPGRLTRKHLESALGVGHVR